MTGVMYVKINGKFSFVASFMLGRKVYVRSHYEEHTLRNTLYTYEVSYFHTDLGTCFPVQGPEFETFRMRKVNVKELAR
jgi:hypothetical protein